MELLGLIEDYWQGLVPLIVPLTLLKHHLNRYPVPEWVHQQVYLIRCGLEFSAPLLSLDRGLFQVAVQAGVQTFEVG